MDYKKMTAPCGLSCFDCVVYLANEDQKMKMLVSKQFNIPLEEVGCKGCKEIGGECPVTSVKCKIYPCSKEKGIEFCYECSDFPCDNLHPYADKAESLPHNTKVFNLCLIKKMGIETWAKEKAKKVKEVYFTGKCNV